MMFRKTMIAAASLVLMTPGLATAQQRMDFTINVGTKNQNGICSVYLPGEGNLELEISVRAQDGNVNVAVQNIPSEWIDDDADPAIRLTADNGQVYNSSGGGYRAGFTYRVSSWYEETSNGTRVLSALAGGESFRATFDGHDAGDFNIQAHSDNITDYAYTWMKNCIEENGGSGNF